MITRRVFLRRFVWANLGVGLRLLAPFPLKTTPTLVPEICGHSKDHPHWLEVLSNGASHIPEAARIDIDGWDNQTIREKGYAALRIAFQENERVFTGNIPLSDENMDNIIKYSKVAQFLLESIKGEYIFNAAFPEITYEQDPNRARLFHDLATFIVKNIIRTINSDFVGFSDLDLRLLRAAESYLRGAISTSENALVLSPERFKTAIIRNIGTAYNNLGLVLNFLGDMEQARGMYENALRLTPDDRSILHNMKAIHRNASYIRRPFPPHIHR